MKKKILLSFLCLMACLHVSAQNFTVGDIKYKVLSAEDKTCEIIGNIGVYGNVSLPVNVEYDASTYTVTSIAEEAFESCSSLTSINIPEGVTRIGLCAFYGCDVHRYSLKRYKHKRWGFLVLFPIDLYHHPRGREKHRRHGFLWLFLLGLYHDSCECYNH